MPRFMDQHAMGSVKPEILKKLLKQPRDDLGVLTQEILYSKEENKVFCITDAPNKGAVEKHHQMAGIKPDWILAVKSSKTYMIFMLS